MGVWAVLTQSFPCIDGGGGQHPGRRGLDCTQRGVGSHVRQVTCSSLGH